MCPVFKGAEEAEKRVSDLQRLVQTPAFQQLGLPLEEKKEAKGVGPASRASNAEAQVRALVGHAGSAVKPVLIQAAIQQVDAGLRAVAEVRQATETTMVVDREVLGYFERLLQDTRERLQEGDAGAIDVAMLYTGLLKGYVEASASVQDAGRIEREAGLLHGSKAREAIAGLASSARKQFYEYQERVRMFLRTPGNSEQLEGLLELNALASKAGVSLARADVYLQKSKQFEEMCEQASIELSRQSSEYIGVLERMRKSAPADEDHAELTRGRYEYASGFVDLVRDADAQLSAAVEGYDPSKFFNADGSFNEANEQMTVLRKAGAIVESSTGVRASFEEKTWQELFQTEQREALGGLTASAVRGTRKALEGVDKVLVPKLGEDGKFEGMVSVFEATGKQELAREIRGKYEEVLEELSAAQTALAQGNEREARRHLEKARELDGEAQALFREASSKYLQAYREERGYRELSAGEKGAYLFSKYGSYACDGIVIGAGIAAEVSSSGTATPLVLGLEAAYWSMRAGKDVYEDYQRTGELSWAKVGEGALFAVPAVGRFAKAYFELSKGVQLTISIATGVTSFGLAGLGVYGIGTAVASGMRTGFTNEELAGLIAGVAPMGLAFRGAVPVIAKWGKEKVATIEIYPRQETPTVRAVAEPAGAQVIPFPKTRRWVETGNASGEPRMQRQEAGAGPVRMNGWERGAQVIPLRTPREQVEMPVVREATTGQSIEMPGARGGNAEARRPALRAVEPTARRSTAESMKPVAEAVRKATGVESPELMRALEGFVDGAVREVKVLNPREGGGVLRVTTESGRRVYVKMVQGQKQAQQLRNEALFQIMGEKAGGNTVRTRIVEEGRTTFAVMEDAGTPVSRMSEQEIARLSPRQKQELARQMGEDIARSFILGGTDVHAEQFMLGRAPGGGLQLSHVDNACLAFERRQGRLMEKTPAETLGQMYSEVSQALGLTDEAAQSAMRQGFTEGMNAMRESFSSGALEARARLGEEFYRQNEQMLRELYSRAQTEPETAWSRMYGLTLSMD